MSASAVTGKRKRSDTLKIVQFKKAATRAAVKKPVEKVEPAATKSKAKRTPKDTQASNGVKTGQTNGDTNGDIHLQIITGSYERVLHGICATIPQEALSKQDDQTEGRNAVNFSDTFLFAAHTSSIRCLAVSPPTNNSKRTLATGSSDERINLYSISTAPTPAKSTMPSTPAKLPSLAGSTSSENAENRSLGNLIHHDRAVTALAFPSKPKLFSAAEDNTIAISRTRDWTMLSSIRAPIPKPQGRPSGDTAGPGEVPAGVNDFAVHPSQRLMLSVGRGERCMRLWNLITGKKAGVLNFERDVLSQVGEGRFSTGEGRKVLWDESGEMYVVGFERAAVVFGIDSKPKAVVKSDRPTKFHQMKFLPSNAGAGGRTLAVSTEDGRVLFYDLSSLFDDADSANLPQCPCIAQLGGPVAGIAGRVKDFEVLTLSPEASWLAVITASSDGAIRIWKLDGGDVKLAEGQGSTSPQVGHLTGTLETSSRITCLTAFAMDGKAVDGANGSTTLGGAEVVADGVSEDEDDDK